jgi:glycosyltransferase involved in cell wall biosynthesis
VEREIQSVLQTVPAYVKHIIVVDDASPDSSADLVTASAKQDERITLIHHPSNQGVGGAMVTGYRTALGLGAQIVVKIDGDGQMDPGHLVRLLRPIVRQEADFTKGNRFVHRRDLAGMPWIRVAGNLGLSFLTKLASGYWNIFDPTNGYIAVRRELVESIDVDRLGPGYFFETSLLVEANLSGAVLKDVSIPSRYADEVSSLSPGRILVRFPWLLARAAVRRIVIRNFLRDFTAVALFLVAGLVSASFGLAFGLHEWILRYGTGVPTPTGTILLAVLPTLAGFQLIVQAVVMDISNVPQKSPWADNDERPISVALIQRELDEEKPMRLSMSADGEKHNPESTSRAAS